MSNPSIYVDESGKPLLKIGTKVIITHHPLLKGYEGLVVGYTDVVDNTSSTYILYRETTKGSFGHGVFTGCIDRLWHDRVEAIQEVEGNEVITKDNFLSYYYMYGAVKQEEIFQSEGYVSRAVIKVRGKYYQADVKWGTRTTNSVLLGEPVQVYPKQVTEYTTEP